jgi:hypothetical protein
MVSILIDPSTARLIIEKHLGKDVLAIFPESLPGVMNNGYFDVVFTDFTSQRITEWQVFLWAQSSVPLENPALFIQEVTTCLTT